MERIYLDHAATTPIYPEIIRAMREEEFWANPSSIHKNGRTAREAVELSRQMVADLIGAEPHEIYFTSGGTESNNAAISTAIGRGTHLITSNIEHKSISLCCSRLEQERGFIYEQVPVDQDGLVKLDVLENRTRKKTTLVSVMTVNNEIGSIQPIKKVVQVVKGKSGDCLVHTDAAQAAGKLKIRVKDLGVDMMSLSAHKFGGPRGIGALYIRSGLREIRPFLVGGGQELGFRSGTENVPAIVGFGQACRMSGETLDERLTIINRLKLILLQKLEKVPGVYVNGNPENSSPYILNLGFKHISSDLLMMNLDTHGIMVSTGSACDEGRSDVSSVLRAIGAPADGGIRISLGWSSTEKEVTSAASKIENLALSIRNMDMEHLVEDE